MNPAILQAINEHVQLLQQQYNSIQAYAASTVLTPAQQPVYKQRIEQARQRLASAHFILKTIADSRQVALSTSMANKIELCHQVASVQQLGTSCPRFLQWKKERTNA